jgi:mRNA interferase MazF
MNCGEIWEIDFNPSTGAEISKKRPGVIISDDNIGILPLKIVVPITEWKDYFIDLSWMTELIPSKINNLKKVSCADSYQVKSISHRRLIKKIGKVTFDELNEIVAGVGICINMK